MAGQPADKGIHIHEVEHLSYGASDFGDIWCWQKVRKWTHNEG